MLAEFDESRHCESTGEATLNETDRRSSITELQERECLELMATATVCLVAFTDSGGQQLLPLNFAMVDGVIYFRTADVSVLASLAAGLDDVAFAVVHHGANTRDGWSVGVRGATARVEDPATIARVMDIPRLRPWAPGPRDVVVALTPRSIDGRRVSSH